MNSNGRSKCSTQSVSSIGVYFCRPERRSEGKSALIAYNITMVVHDVTGYLDIYLHFCIFVSIIERDRVEKRETCLEWRGMDEDSYIFSSR